MVNAIQSGQPPALRNDHGEIQIQMDQQTGFVVCEFPPDELGRLFGQEES
jgi:Fe-S cluster biogenesis protein NfuA